MVELPPSLVEHARAWLASPGEPVPARDAATVVLLRDGAAGLEAYLLLRRTSMAFAGGMYAFPGGSVDPRDGAPETGWAGPDASAWAAAFGCGEALARALVCAAVRETFEESGVLLAGPSPDDVVADTTTEDWERERAALLDRSQSVAELLARRRLVLRSDLLRPWGHWVTPEFEPRRFDTRFLVAALPAHQQARDVSSEAVVAEWVPVAAAVADAESGRRAMLPPTIAVLRELAGLGSMGAVLAANRTVRRICPRLVADGDALRLEIE